MSRTVPLRPMWPAGADPGRLRTGLLAGFLGFALMVAAVDPGTALDAAARTPVPEKGYRSGRDALRSGVRDYNAGDKQGAVRALEYAADQGQTLALWKLGRMYADGDGVPHDDLKAFEYFSRIADDNTDDSPDTPNSGVVASAFNALGTYFLEGIKGTYVRPNPERAYDIVARGVEFNGNVDLARALQIPGRVLDAFASGYYHVDMRDKGAAATLNTDKVQRMYRYEGSAGVRYGQGGPRDAGAWTVQVAALLRGPMWYDTEENLLIPQGEPSSTFIHRKGAFTVWNLRVDYRVSPTVKLFAGVNNLFDLNRHPIFIALDRSPCTANAAFQNGGCGTSMPGRELLVGLHVDF